MKNNILSGIVLAGGKSSRMGTDKAWLEYRGKTLIENAIDSIKAYCTEILISAQGEKYGELPYPVISDEQQNLGPIGGIVSSLPHAVNHLVLVTACDIPLLAPELLTALISNADSGKLVYLQLSSGQIQPLPLLIPKKLVAVIRRQIELKNYKLQDMIEACIQAEGICSQACIIENEPLNINHPGDLK